jgi:hypothetical protein
MIDIIQQNLCRLLRSAKTAAPIFRYARGCQLTDPRHGLMTNDASRKLSESDPQDLAEEDAAAPTDDYVIKGHDGSDIHVTTTHYSSNKSGGFANSSDGADDDDSFDDDEAVFETTDGNIIQTPNVHLE